MQQLQESGGLFEVNTPDFKQLKACRKEVVMLKALWDTIHLVNSSFDDWKTTLWREINVETMEMDCKKFVKDIRSLDKEMRAWDAFSGLDSAVKNMVTSLRAVGELQNQAIRDRHWSQLMQATQVSSLPVYVYQISKHTYQVKFVMSDETTLSDLLALNLHNFEDEVHGIVDKATKELSMEKTLKELNITWSQMEFQHDQHHRTDTMLLKSDEELIETLEDNQVLMIVLYVQYYVGGVLCYRFNYKT